MKEKKYFRDDILREQIRLAMRQVPTMQATSFVVALVLSYVVRDLVSRVNLFTWLLMISLIVVGRVVLYYRFDNVREGAFAGEHWKNMYLLLAFVSGIIWGLSAFIIFPAGNRELISLFVLVIASLSTATTMSHSSMRLGPAVWAGPAMLLYAVRCFMEGGDFGYTVGTLILLYLFTILRYSFTHNSTIASAITVKFENLELLEEVQRANEYLRREITERKQAEEALGQSEERFAKAFHASPAPLVISRLVDGYVFDVNESFLREFGFRPEEVIGRKASESVLYGLPEERDEFLRLLRSRGQIHEHEIQLRTNSGDMRQALISATVSPIQGEECILTLLIDLTERRKAEEALRQSEARFRSIYENSMEGILVTIPDGRIISANPATCNILGYTEEEIISLGRSGIVDLNDPGLPHLVKERSQTGRCRGELTLLRKDGTRFPAEVSSELFHDEYGQTLTTMIIRDITERKRAQESIQRAYEELESRVEERTLELRAKTQHLEELNAALKVLLNQREEDKAEFEDAIMNNVNNLILPYVERLKKSRLDTNQETYLAILESHIHEITSTFVTKLSLQQLNLTPSEMQVAALVREGKMTKEIAEILCISEKAVSFHRNNIRRKLGLQKSKRNLRSYLTSLA